MNSDMNSQFGSPCGILYQRVSAVLGSDEVDEDTPVPSLEAFMDEINDFGRVRLLPIAMEQTILWTCCQCGSGPIVAGNSPACTICGHINCTACEHT